MEKDMEQKMDLEKNSIPTQKHKTIRQPTPIKKRSTLSKETEDIEMEDKTNISKNKIDDIKEGPNTNKKRAQSYPSGFENIPKKYNVDLIILKLLSVRNKKNKEVKLEYNEIIWLCEEVTKIFMNQPVCLNLEAPVNVCGDIHGQYSDLIRLFEAGGYPPEVNYLFLGDYVDRGEQSIETICLLFCFKIKCTQTFFLLRGNHECASLNREYGFYDECKRRYNVKLWKKFVDVFNCMPYTAIVEDKMIFMHGGLSPSLKSLAQLNEIIRPTDVPDEGLLCDLVWSDPESNLKGWEINNRGVSYTFNEKIVDNFLTIHNLEVLVRAHQVVEKGYEFFNGRKCVTIFSAPNYCGEFDNAGAMMTISSDLVCGFKVFKPKTSKP